MRGLGLKYSKPHINLVTTDSSLRQILIAIPALLLLAVFWVFLAPVQLGGRTTYVIVDGNSMEPGFHYGDLVLIQRKSGYLPGEAVVYKDPNLGVHVFHRIVGSESDRFVLQGDNNSWLDSYKPGQNEIVGKLWLHVPKLGKAINWLRIPLNVSLSAGLFGGIIMFDMIKKPSGARKERQASTGGNSGSMIQAAIFGFAVMALLFAGLGLFSFIRPLYLPAEAIPYQQDGNFFYSAAGTPGVYDTEVVKVGEPIFPKLTCFLNVGLTYNVFGEGLTGIAGEQSMYARVFDVQSGWQRTIPLNPKSPFLGGSQISTATLDLCQVESLVNLVETEAGVKQINYSLEIVSEMTFTASVNGVPVSDTFSPRLLFTYDKVQFYLAGSASSEPPLHSSKSGSVGGPTPQPNSKNLLGFTVPIWAMRYLSIIGLGASLLGLVAVAMYWYRTASLGDDFWMKLKYGNKLVKIPEQDLVSATSMIDVTSMDDLARLADRHGATILHMARNSRRYYFVQADGSTYRFAEPMPGLDFSRAKNDGMTDGRIGMADSPRKPVHPEITQPDKPVNLKPTAPSAFIAEHKNTPAESPHPVERKVSNPKAPPDRIQDYGFNTSVINRGTPQTTGSIEYVIRTGILECELPARETSVLGTIKLQPCDPSFAS